MSTPAVVILIVVIVVVLGAAAFAWSAARRRGLRQRFGPEYETAVEGTGSRRAAEDELRQRERRHQDLDIRPLSVESQQSYSARWEKIQEQFVDDPTAAVADADTLVTSLIAERGYPTDGYDQQLSDLSVEHAQTLTHYRSAHDISITSADGTASTEDLRQALVHYRALFGDLLGAGTTDGNPPSATTDGNPIDTALDGNPLDTATDGEDDVRSANDAAAGANDAPAAAANGAVHRTAE